MYRPYRAVRTGPPIDRYANRPLLGSISWRQNEEHDSEEDEAVALIERRRHDGEELDVAGHEEVLRRLERGRGGGVLASLGETQ